MPAFRSFIFLLVCGSVGLAAELRSLAGKSVTGELAALDDKEVVLKGDGGPVATKVDDVIEVKLREPGPLPAGTKYSDVELTDGSLLHCSQVLIKGKQVELTVLPDLKVTVPLSAVSYVLNGAQDAKVREEWQQLLAKKGNRDILAIRAEDVLNQVEGTFGDGDDKGERIEFERDNGQKVRPQVERAQGLVFVRKPDENAPPTVCKVTDTHRNLLVAGKLALNPSNLTVITVAGARVEYPSADAVARLDYSKGKLTYLSDLDPASIDVSSADERIEKYRRNQNLDDGPTIRLAGKSELAAKPYTKGLVLFARTVVVYNIGGDYKDLKAVLGLDAQAGGDSHVKVTFEGDGRELRTVEVARGEEPKPLTLDVRNVKQLRITVSSELLDLGNHVVLADAKVSK
jgi:hypothetical protein